MEIKIGIADILTAFSCKYPWEIVIGTKVWWSSQEEFLTVLEQSIKDFDWSSCRQPGQAYITLPNKCCEMVCAGVGKRTLNPDDYVIRLYRGKVGLYLKRDFAGKVDNVATVVYTLGAYLNDPDVSEKEINQLRDYNYTHILVAVLASAGSKSPLTSNRFVHNLAGGNKEALLWTADEIREKAKEIKEYSNEWCVIAD